MIIFLTIVHVLVCLFLIIVVLLQSGKAADLAGAFGGMGSQTAFGPRGAATVLTKATAGAAALFMATSILLGGLQGTRQAGGESVIERTGTGGSGAPASGTAPAAPGTQTIPLQAPQVNVDPVGESQSSPAQEGPESQPQE